MISNFLTGGYQNTDGTNQQFVFRFLDTENESEVEEVEDAARAEAYIYNTCSEENSDAECSIPELRQSEEEILFETIANMNFNHTAVCVRRTIWDAFEDVSQLPELYNSEIQAEIVTSQCGGGWNNNMNKPTEFYNPDLQVITLPRMYGDNVEGSFLPRQLWRKYCGTTNLEMGTELIEWVKLNGGYIGNLELDFVQVNIRDPQTLAKKTAMVRGIRSLQNFRKGEKVFWLPFHITLFPEVAFNNKDIGSLLDSGLINENEAMLIWLLWEMLHIETSPYRPYLCVLPESAPQPIALDIHKLHPSFKEQVRQNMGVGNRDHSTIFRQRLKKFLINIQKYFPRKP
eukprot:UN31618